VDHVRRLSIRSQKHDRWIRAACCCAMIVLVHGVLMAQSIAAGETSASANSPPASPTTEDANAAETLGAITGGAIEDVMIDPDGNLRGRVIARGMPGELTGVRVQVVAGRRVVAVAATDAQGRFVVQHLPQGLYRIMAEGPGLMSGGRCFRVWPAATAPPRALDEIALLPAADVLGRAAVSENGPIVRGQHAFLFPIMSLRQAATITGVAAGAIAAPIIYHNTRLDNKVSASR